MALPKPIQDQVDEAERIQRQLAGETPAPTQVAQPDTPPAANADPQPVPPPEPEAPTPVAIPAEPEQDAAYWRQRFETMRGKYEAEVPRMLEQMRQQGAQLQQITEQMRQQPQAPMQPEQPLVTKKDEETFGSDLVDMARRVSQEETRQLLKRLEPIEALLKKLAPKVERVKQVEQEVAQSREDRFWGEIEKGVSDWQQINADQAWLAWLKEYDPISGQTRQDGLNAAQQALDHKRVIAMFTLFKSTLPQAPAPGRSKSELARQVAPARNSTVTTPPQSPKTYTGVDYAFWHDPRRVNDTDVAQVVAMKAELDKAYTEGRIQW